jgi:hypothetical protein
MPLTAEQRLELENFPLLLRYLLDQEMAAGNEIVDVCHGHPAAPIGAYVILNHPITTRSRKSGGGYRYRPESSSQCSGWFTDETGHFFILEPPDPNAGAYPDMDLIRETANKSSTYGFSESVNNPCTDSSDIRDAQYTTSGAVLDRFIQSTQLDYDKWREGESYELALIESANETERNQIEEFLVQRQVGDWRDVEALAAMDSPRTRNILSELLNTGSTEMKLWVWDYAPKLVSRADKVEILLRAINSADIYSGLGRALDKIVHVHPPSIIAELMKATLTRSGDVACHLAAMLYYLHGLSKEPFDWDHRPFFLSFNTDSNRDRKAVFRELCDKIGVDHTQYVE